MNLLGVVPRQDAFWEGELAEWSRLLSGIGLCANPVFGPEGGVEGLRDLTRAGISLVLSPWGAEVARQLEREAGVPWLDAGGAAGRCRRRPRPCCAPWRSGWAWTAQAFLAAEARREDHHLRRLAEAYFRHDLQRDFALVAGSLQHAGLAGFLVGTLGWVPRTIVIADGPPESARPDLLRRLAAATARFGARVLFSEDAGRNPRRRSWTRERTSCSAGPSRPRRRRRWTCRSCRSPSR